MGFKKLQNHAITGPLFKPGENIARCLYCFGLTAGQSVQRDLLAPTSP